MANSELLITGGRVYTADPRAPWARAVLTRGETITYVGDEAGARAEATAAAEEIHLPGALVLPGLNDSHIHTNMGGESLTMLNLEGVLTVAELRERLKAFAAAHPERAWIEGTGLSYEALFHEATPRLVLDAVVPDRPVFLRAFDWHAGWANTAALHLAGILNGADVPPPNEVVVNAEGRAVGMVKERLATTLISDRIPEVTPEQEEANVVHAFRYLNGMGITSLQNMDGTPERLVQYERLHERGDLTVRALHYMSVRETTPRERLPQFAALTGRYTGAWNRVRGIKLFIDGVVESKTAMMVEPYADGSGELGVPDLDLDAYREIVRQADALGMQVSTHAIGDRGVRCALDAYEAAMAANATLGRYRHRVEHIEVLHPEDLPRFARLGVTCSMQPLHCAPTGDPDLTPYTELLGPARLPTAFMWRALLETGARLSFGSDWPVVTPDVFQGLHVAVTRTNIHGQPSGGYQPQQVVTLAQALDAYTTGAAYAEGEEGRKGMVRAGQLADLTVFSRDLFSLPAEAILGTAVALTVVGGRVVHRRG